MKFLKKTLPFLLASIASTAAAQNTQVVTIASIDYAKNYVQAKIPEGRYERFEHRGLGSTDYCVQTFCVEASVAVEGIWSICAIDGLDGLCDEKVDAYTVIYNGNKQINFCDEDDNAERCGNLMQMLEIFKERNYIDFIKIRWNAVRENCEDKCTMNLSAVQRTMSKKKVQE
mgnify:CR=1 FL=1